MNKKIGRRGPIAQTFEGGSGTFGYKHIFEDAWAATGHLSLGGLLSGGWGMMTLVVLAENRKVHKGETCIVSKQCVEST